MNSGYYPLQFYSKMSRKQWLEYGHRQPGLGARSVTVLMGGSSALKEI